MNESACAVKTMEVVRQNFKETLPKISTSIKKADFLVIDAEFTGLVNGQDVSMFDLPRDYYKCLLYGSTEFLVVQFGLCAFYWDEEKKHYMNDAFNFYLFPRGKPGPEKTFLCQSTSLDFLIAQGFDFNKVIRDGISYMTEPSETKLREILVERQKSIKEKEAITIPEEHRAYIDETCKKVRKFLDEKKADDMLIDRCNSFVRLLLYQELKIRFRNEIILETQVLENKNRILKVLRAKSQEDEKEHAAQKKEREWEELEDAVGFSKVARMISQSEKLVIGHNMLLDVIHTLNNFFQPLPDDYIAFKEFAHCMFPSMLDTKYMSSLPPFKDKVNSSVLQHLLVTLSEAPFALPEVGSHEGLGYKKAEDKHHEAGYDAYITGLCFLAMHAHLSKMRGEENVRASPTSPVLKPFLNKLFLAKTAHQDSPYMNLSGADPTPSREHVFHLTFPKDWIRNDINLLFSPYGPIVCQFLEDTQAIVALARRDQARAVMRGLTSNKRVKLIPYDLYNKTKTQPSIVKKAAPPSVETRNQKDTCIITSSPVKNLPASVPKTPSASSSPQVAEKSPRMRTTSATALSPPVLQTRKRTSSGVIQVDGIEPPPPKKTEYSRSNSDGALKTATNGRRKITITSEIEGNGICHKEIKDKTIEKTEGKKERKDKIIDMGEGKKGRKDKIIDPLSMDRKVSSKEEKGIMIERFDRKIKNQESKCVTAFKESDSWD